ncbi:MAG: glycerol-3-phosphate dehydrogenase/oxidase, partial [Planctomycetota bacterium]
LLVEARDFAIGTSSRSSRLVHGGLRYLQQAHLSLVREALHERERLLRLAPHLVRPLPVLLPFYPDSGGSRLMAWLGVHAYSWLAGRSTMPGPRRMNQKQALAAFPGLRSKGLKGAVHYYDAATVDSRLTLANVTAAAEAGALVSNHCELLGPSSTGGLRLRDGVTGAEVEVRSKHVVNAAGPRADAVRRLFAIGSDDLVRTSRGSHLILDPRAGETSLAAFLPDRRIQFVVPHQDGTVAGTTDVYEDATAADPTVPGEDLRYLLEALGYLLDPAPTVRDVRFAYCGWRSLPAARGPAGALNREAFLVRESIASGDLHTAVGGKLTTHRAFAERVIGQVFGIAGDDSKTRVQALPGGDGPREVLDPLWWRHGSRASRLRSLARERSHWQEPICSHRPMLAVEAIYALREQAAVTFSDLMLRRLVHAQGPCMRRECLRAAHELFVLERGTAIDGSFDAAATLLEAEVSHLTGGLVEAAAAALSC